ncbi:lipopolysaccharide assembly protein LapA domain-containing protein [Nocardia sp. CA-119907]|uniref:lipopolysaccharide assembly protein LapA domain-containing protein n=1 Tax=Nocardia sp. CA-119907 TaxID=3239973 RepID=UPI003D984BC6
MTSHAESPEPERTEDVAPPSPTGPKTVEPTGRTTVEPTGSTTVEPTGRKTVAKSRTGQTWVGLIVAALIGIVVLIFILQNLEEQRVDLFFWDFSLPVGIMVLLSVIAGALVMALVGGVRIVQLRRAVKR